MTAHVIGHWLTVAAAWLAAFASAHRLGPPLVKGAWRLIRGSGEDTRKEIAAGHDATEERIARLNADTTGSISLVKIANDEANRQRDRADKLADKLDAERETCLKEKIALIADVRAWEDRSSAAESTFQRAVAEHNAHLVECAVEKRELTKRAESLALELVQLRQHMMR